MNYSTRIVSDEFCVDRAMLELRRGRAFGIVDSEVCTLVASVETLRSATFAQLQQTGHPHMLALTHERAKVLGLALHDGDSLGLELPHGIDPAMLKELAGVNPRQVQLQATTFPVQRCNRAATACLQLAKKARLVPALIVVEQPPERCDSVLRVGMEDLLHHMQQLGRLLRRVSEARVPLAGHENCKFILYRDDLVDGEHLAITIGDMTPHRPVPVRIHSACLTGDVFGSLRCDCGEQLRGAVKQIAATGGGAILYMAQEGRGIGLANKLRAYELQDNGLDTLDADQHLGFTTDERNYRAAAAMLRDLKLTRVQLMTNNPEKLQALDEEGIEVMNRLPLVTPSNPHSERYVRAKLERAGHLSECENSVSAASLLKSGTSVNRA